MKRCGYLGTYFGIDMWNKDETNKQLLRVVHLKSMDESFKERLKKMHVQLKSTIQEYREYGGILRCRKRRRTSKHKYRHKKYSRLWYRQVHRWFYRPLCCNITTDGYIQNANGTTTIKNLMPCSFEGVLKYSNSRDLTYIKSKQPSKVPSLKQLAIRKLKVLLIRYPSLRERYEGCSYLLKA